MRTTYILLFTIISFLTVQAQVDRTVMPTPGPAPEINLGEPEIFKLNNGLTVLVVENHKLPRVSIQLSIDNPPILEGDKAGVSLLTGSLLGKGSKNIAKDQFNEEIDFLGARLNFSSQGAYAQSLSKYFSRMMELLADAAIYPNFTQDEFDKEKDILLTGLKSEEKVVSSISARVQRALAYGKNHPYGEFATEQTVNNVTLTDVEEFYRDYFVPANAYLIVIGDITLDEVKTLTNTYFTSWTKAVPPSFSYSKPANVPNTQINLVDMPNAVQSEITVQNLVDLKMKDDDFIAAILANQILGGGSDSRVNLNLREDKGYTYGAYTSLGNDKYAPARFVATAEVRNSVTDSSVVELLKELELITSKPVTEKELKTTKALYAGSFIMALEDPQTIARYALNIEKENLPKNFYKSFLEKLEKVSKTDVELAAKKYFNVNNARVVVVGKGSEILANLEKINFNGKKLHVLSFSKTADRIETPNYNTAIPEGVTANTIMEKYIDAIGGKTKLESVTSFAMSAAAEMQGMKLDLEVKKTTNNQLMQDVKMMGNSISKQVLNGDNGYMVMQGQRIDLTEEELIKSRTESLPFPELSYLANNNVSLEGMEMVGDKKAYKIKVTDDKTTFYDVETGLKVQEVTLTEMQGQQISSTSNFEDYKDVSGILLPFKLTQSFGPQNFEFIISDIKINEGVSAEDFE
ncbi:M16 family metallopeptidase [Maribacter hydrothermalis]|uniref:Peptidase M16 n=1 Tax=Maribacter hydrothermalis TaxID=1836467 RepID=A0A1B7Z3N2_9FLAO|nr:pitrilysin family protein [Maribacter hydrothermalis]APQ17058.1 peptidase M16 [Maribacter hydrothermalis]OBR37319.1 peptidase M16 [Maribacter hydrothermalis]